MFLLSTSTICFSLHCFIQYEILHNPKTVDLLVSLAYVSASEGVMEDPLPAGLGLRVPLPADVVALPKSRPTVGGAPPQYEERRAKVLTCGPDGLYEFDDLSLTQVCAFEHFCLGPPILILAWALDAHLHRQTDP